MATIDKTYTNKWEEYCEYRDWAMGQKFVCPNGDIIRPIDYLYRWNKEDFDGEKYLPIMNTPLSLDYFLIKHCPIRFVRNRMLDVHGEDDFDAMLNGTSEYDTFSKEGKYGTRFRMTKHPIDMKANRPCGRKSWFVQLRGEGRYCQYDEDKNRWTWDDELRSGSGGNTAHIRTIKALKRHMRKWKLPKGTIVDVRGRYIGDNYEFLIY